MLGDTLKAGDLVEVRSAGEILATVDEQGTLEGMPFMHEMLPLIGRRFVVDKRAEKVCDTLTYRGSRRIPGTVMLADLRCDGSGHDGCQAECRLYWKQAWLRRVGPGAPAAPSGPGDDSARASLARRLTEGVRRAAPDRRPQATYRCQATELLRASSYLRTMDPRPYLREYTSGNVPLGRFVRVVARAAVEEPLRKLGLTPTVYLKGPGTPAPAEPPLDLKPGEWVQVKSAEEIARTLTPNGKNRGLWFDREMLPHCGKVYRVRSRVSRIVDERTGRMIEMKSDCIILDGAVCSGDLSHGRWFCPREIYPYWREAWLRRADPSMVPVAACPARRDALGDT